MARRADPYFDPVTRTWGPVPEPRETALHTGRALVCGDCWSILRPDQYEPMGGAAEPDSCDRCGAEWSGLHRVSWAEIDAEPVRAFGQAMEREEDRLSR